MSVRIPGNTKCLGWCNKTFQSIDKITIRFCSKCRAKRDSHHINISRIEMRAMLSGSKTAEKEAVGTE